MADNEAPVTPVTETPAPATPVVAPVEASSTPAVEAPKVEAPVVESAKAEPAKTETVLAEAIDKAAQPAETKTAKPAETTEEPAKELTDGGQSDNPAPPPTYEPFKAPEGTTLDPERVTQFTELLADLELKGKADHALVQEFGQKAVDFHVQEVKRAVDDVTKLYQTAWDKQKTVWKDAFFSDPEIGGNRAQTTIDSALTFIRTHGGTEEQQKEFRNLMETTGIGNHPAIIRILASAGRAMGEGKPLAAPKPVPQPTSKLTKMYGKNQ